MPDPNHPNQPNQTDTLQIRILTHQGLEHVTAAEAASCGLADVTQDSGVVMGTGSPEVLIRLNLRLRSGLRVLQLLSSLPLRRGSTRASDLIYQAARAIPWHRYFDASRSFAVYVHGGTDELNDSRYGALKLKDAIADHFRDHGGRRPDVDKRSPDIPVSLFLSGDRAEIALDASGPGLHLRGYRTSGGAAPLRETLAAALLLHTGLGPAEAGSGTGADEVRVAQTTGPVLDPMCGSGTPAIEAAMIRADRTVGLHRSFAFEAWKHVDASLARRIRDEYRSLEPVAGSGRAAAPIVYASDVDPGAVRNAERNATRAGVRELIRIDRCDISDARDTHGLGKEPTGRLILNPPYGERLSDDDVSALYARIGDTLKQQFAGWEAWILSSSMSALKRIGLRYEENLQIRTGGLDARFRKYSLF